MNKEEFERMVANEVDSLSPEVIQKLENVVFVTEDDVAESDRALHGLRPQEVLLGLYSGISRIRRGQGYGIGPTLPDKITLYRLPIIEEAAREKVPVRKVIKDTLMHEIAHHLGMEEDEVEEREEKGWGEA